jgi:hypothetical protein
MRPGVSDPHVLLALLFIVYFVLTLAKGLGSPRQYLYKTAVVVLYSLLTWSDHGRRYTKAEWLADGLVWYQFVSAFWFLSWRR